MIKPKQKAFLVIVCDERDNHIIGAEIWSSPEWEQSRTLGEPVYIVYYFADDTFDKARKAILSMISQPTSRYHRYLQYLPEFKARKKKTTHEHFDHDDCRSCGTPSVPAEGVPDQVFRRCPMCEDEWFENFSEPVFKMKV